MLDYGYRRTPRAAPKAPRFESSKWRVVALKPLPVSAEEDGSEVVADLAPRDTCDLMHKELKTLPDGTVRGMIIDPVWKGWITVRTRFGDSNLEHLDGGEPGASLGRLASSSEAPAAASAPPTVKLTPKRIIDLRNEFLADDIEV